MNILVADDHTMTRYQIEKILSIWGHNIKAYSDGESAWKDLTAGYDPEIMILDWEMPGINGLDLIKKIRSDESKCPAYLVMLTMREENRDVLECFEAGVDDFLSKPVQVADLQDALERGIKILGAVLNPEDRRAKVMENVYRFMEQNGRLDELLDEFSTNEEK